MRERLIAKNNYTTKQIDFSIPSLPNNSSNKYKDLPVEDYYYQRSLEIEGKINWLKVNRPKGLDSILELI
jgi:hypothetical protein